jgi:AcrR family transcriptional regulator
MPRTPADNQRIKDERHVAILAAARTVFARKGLAAAKISDVATAAGLSHGLVYHYFASKEAMYAELIERLFERATTDLTKLERSKATPLQRVRAFVELRCARLREEPDMFWLVMQAVLHPDALPPSTRAALRAFGERGRAVMLKTLREGQARGDVVAGDPVELCTAIFALLHGLAMSQSLDADGPRVMPNVDLILRLIVSGVPDAR